MHVIDRRQDISIRDIEYEPALAATLSRVK